MNLQDRIAVFDKLGTLLEELPEKYPFVIDQAKLNNAWFTYDSIINALGSWKAQLTHDMLSSWVDPYNLSEPEKMKKILVIMAGNIPLVGFHDFLTVLILGHKVILKMSSNDNVILPLLIDQLIQLEPIFKSRIVFIDTLENKEHDFDAVIVTGSNYTAKYFDYYFKDIKRIIRRNRRSIAILRGNETDAQLSGLASDIFLYFGLGCRNVSKVFLYRGFNLDKLFKAFYPYKKIIYHKKYANNYIYNKTMLLMNNYKLIENGFIVLKEDTSLFSPVGMLYYDFYDNISSVKRFIDENRYQLQCVVSGKETLFGTTQNPNLWDYADDVDTVDFIRNL